MTDEYSPIQRDILDRMDRQDEIGREYREDVIDRLARIEERLEPLKDHEMRIRGIERKQWLFAGAAAAVGAVLGKFGFHFPFSVG